MNPMIELGELISKAPKVRCGSKTLPVLSATKSDGIVLQDTRFKKQIASKDQSQYLVVSRGQLVMTIHLDQGVLGLQNVVEEGIVSPAYKVWNIDTSVVRESYLERALKSSRAVDYFASKGQSTVAGRCSVSDAELLKLRIPLPAQEKQDEIVSTLEAVEAHVASMECILSKFDELVKSRFIEMFGDPLENPRRLPIMRIEEIADVQTGATPLRSKAEYYCGTIPWVKTGEVAAGLLEEAEETITELALQETNCKLFPAGTILVAMYGQGDTRGKAAILRQAAATNQACAAIILNEGYDADFILSQLNLCYEDLRVRSLGGNQKNLSLKIIKAYELIVPPTEYQEAFMAFVQQADKSKFAVQQTIDKLELLKASLMQKYFG